MKRIFSFIFLSSISMQVSAWNCPPIQNLQKALDNDETINGVEIKKHETKPIVKNFYHAQMQAYRNAENKFYFQHVECIYHSKTDEEVVVSMKTKIVPIFNGDSWVQYIYGWGFVCGPAMADFGSTATRPEQCAWNSY